MPPIPKNDFIKAFKVRELKVAKSPILVISFCLSVFHKNAFSVETGLHKKHRQILNPRTKFASAI